MDENNFVCPLREDRCPVFTREDADGIKETLERIHDNQRELIERDQRHDRAVKIMLFLVAVVAAVAGFWG